jgi:hypothetical protein
MRSTLILTMFILATLGVAAETSVDVSLDVFGLSYHQDRDFGYNERNPGLGVSLAIHDVDDDFLSYVVSGGVYKDSFFDRAEFLVVGVRGLIGSKDSFHGSLSVQGGYFEGSGFDGLGAFPVVSVGYDRFDLCFSGNPFETKSEGEGSSRVLAMFLKIRVWEF